MWRKKCVFTHWNYSEKRVNIIELASITTYYHKYLEQWKFMFVVRFCNKRCKSRVTTTNKDRHLNGWIFPTLPCTGSQICCFTSTCNGRGSRKQDRNHIGYGSLCYSHTAEELARAFPDHHNIHIHWILVDSCTLLVHTQLAQYNASTHNIDCFIFLLVYSAW